MTTRLLKRGALIAAVPGLLWLAGCAPTLKDPWGLSVSRGESPAPRPAPRTFQADLSVLPRGPGSFPVSARLYAEPLRRYRLDVFGFPSQIAASWLWEEGQWVLVRHDRREIRTGTGVSLEQEGVPLRLPDVHAVLGFLWGDPLPSFPGRDDDDDSPASGLMSDSGRGTSSSGTPASGLMPGDSAHGPRAFGASAVASGDGVVRWTHAGEAWEARFDPATGVCREVRSPSLTLRYAAHRMRGGAAVPDEAEVFAEGRSLLVLRVKERVESPLWKKDPFPLPLPDSYERR